LIGLGSGESSISISENFLFGLNFLGELSIEIGSFSLSSSIISIILLGRFSMIGIGLEEKTKRISGDT